MKAWMRIATGVGLLGLMATTHAGPRTLDYAVTAVTGGINLFAVTAKGTVLVEGSPFAADDPTPPISVITGLPASTPILVTLDELHEHVYAVYPADHFGAQSMLVGWKITSKGLTEQFGITTSLGESGNHGFYPVDLSFQNGYAVVYYGPAEGQFGLTAELYGSKGRLINTFQGPVVSPVLIQSLNSVRVDPSGDYLFACYSNQNISASGVTMSASSNAYAITSGKLLSTTVDPAAVAALCPQ